MRHHLLPLCLFALSSVAQASSLSPADLSGTWRMSAVSSAKYGCDNSGAMTVTFAQDADGGLTGVYRMPGLTESFAQPFRPVASMATVLSEQSAGGRAITMDAPRAMRRILAVETAKGADGRPNRLEWSSMFGGFGEEPSPFDSFTPSAWLTRCEPM